MLNPEFGDHLLRNFLLFEKYSQEVGDQYIIGPPTYWSPNLKVGGPVSPVLLRLCDCQTCVSQISERIMTMGLIYTIRVGGR